MPTYEERLTNLEQAFTEHKPFLQNIAYELAIVKGIVSSQIKTTEQLKTNINSTNSRLDKQAGSLDLIEKKLNEHNKTLTQILTLLTTKTTTEETSETTKEEKK